MIKSSQAKAFSSPPHRAVQPAQRLLQDGRYRLVGILGFILGAGYALFVRFYQAAGGHIGLAAAPRPGMMWASYTAGVTILIGAVACLVLTQPSLRTVPSWSMIIPGVKAPRVVVIICCTVPTMIAAVIAVGHGAGGGTAKALQATGLGVATIHPDGGPGNVADLRWEIGFYQPWFLVFGVCMALSAIGYLRQSAVPPRTVRIVSTALFIACVLCSVMVLVAMMLHWNLDIGI